MKTQIEGNPGYNNTYQESTFKQVETLYNNATVYQQCATTRLEAYFKRLNQEISCGVSTPVTEELMEYTNSLDNNPQIEDKLQAAGFTPSSIRDAKRNMKTFTRKALQYISYPSAQNIILLLMSRIKNDFNTVIYPQIEAATPLRTIMEQIRTKIVLPIMDTLNTNGAYDEHLCLTHDHIYGMLYYLCAINYISWGERVQNGADMFSNHYTYVHTPAEYMYVGR